MFDLDDDRDPFQEHGQMLILHMTEYGHVDCCNYHPWMTFNTTVLTVRATDSMKASLQGQGHGLYQGCSKVQQM